MYKNILKKDLKRKKTMNIILFLFIILATTFISSSVNNLINILNAMDSYFEKSGMEELVYIVFEGGEEETKKFVEENENVKGYSYYESATLSNQNCDLNGEKIDYTNAMTVSCIEEAGYHLFDQDNKEIPPLKDGEVMLPAVMEKSLGLKSGDIITIHNGEFSKNYQYIGCTKDIAYGSAMMGLTRMIFSYHDYMELMEQGGFSKNYNFFLDTDNEEALTNDFSKTGIATFLILNKQSIKMAYIMDMVIAGVMLIVSICLILISIVILRFTIIFTLNEEFREIGVMKAIGIKNRKIRGIYIVKYLAISVTGAVIGFFVGMPFSRLMIGSVSDNIVISSSNTVAVNILCSIFVIAVVLIFCYLSTRKVNKFSPIDAIRNGSNGERYRRKSIFNLNNIKMSPIPFMALNDIFSDLRKFGALILTFCIGVILIIIPMTTITTLTSNKLVNWFGMSESDVYISNEMFIQTEKDREHLKDKLEDIQELLAEHQMPSKTFQETLFKFTISYEGEAWNSLATQGTGIDTDQYVYIEGTPPRNVDEVAITHIISEKIKAQIGDTVTINMGNRDEKYIVTAIYQSMNNMGEGIRFHPDVDLDYSLAVAEFATQIVFTDHPSSKEVEERFGKIKPLFPDCKVQSGGEYLNDMMGNTAGAVGGVKQLILIVVLAINILVSVLMVKSFIAKETGEIGMMKSIGFRNRSIVWWQTIRIGIVLVISIVLGILISEPIAQISSGAIFRMMGASSIEFETNAVELYVIYPLLILAVTLTASFIAAQQVRRISASETSNIE